MPNWETTPLEAGMKRSGEFNERPGVLDAEHPENFEALSMARLGASAKSSMATHEQLDTLMVKFETRVDTLIDKEGVEEEEALQKALIADRDQQRA